MFIFFSPSEGSSEYTTCSGLLDESSSTYPESALFQIADNGPSLDKLVIGKPANTGDANTGYMDPSTLAECLQTAQGQGWGKFHFLLSVGHRDRVLNYCISESDAGVMVWQVRAMTSELSRLIHVRCDYVRQTVP